MFARKTVFVVGAGCSYEYGLPLGETLKANIVSLMHSLDNARRGDLDRADLVLFGAVQELARAKRAAEGLEGRSWYEASCRIIEGLPHLSSIDRFLDFRRDDEWIVRLGKLAIVRAILKAEAASTLAGKRISHEAIQRKHGGPNWLGQIFTRMTEGITNPKHMADAFRNLTFICFNYDRCIEHYFFTAIKEVGSFSDTEAARFVETLDIVHPYGRIGDLPWDRKGNPGFEVSFGETEIAVEKLIALANQIKTFTEGEHDADNTKLMHQALTAAEQVCFLGFSFLDQNMELLTSHDGAPGASMFATVLGMSGEDQNIAHAMMMALGQGVGNGFNNPVEKHGVTAGQFLANAGNRLRR